MGNDVGAKYNVITIMIWMFLASKQHLVITVLCKELIYISIQSSIGKRQLHLSKSYQGSLSQITPEILDHL